MQRYWIWLAEKTGVSNQEMQALLSVFPSPEDLYCAGKTRLLSACELSEKAILALADKDLAPAENILLECRRKAIRVMTWQDEEYPNRLKNIADPPLVLYWKGKLPDFDAVPAVGVVGTRKASAYGCSVARRMGWQISRCGGMVVSGMASGIDAAASDGALDTGKPAVGILGCGVDRIYPTENRMLFRKMEECGCLISEYPPGTPAYKWNFPKRNRIISGLCCGVLVVEAPARSGALITARQAMEQGRDVFVVPGNIDVASCEGSNALLRDGAIMAASGWDVVSEYAHLYPDVVVRDLTRMEGANKPLQVAQNVVKPDPQPAADKKSIDNPPLPPYSDRERKPSSLSPDEQAVLACLSREEANTDDVIAASGLSAGAALAALTLLQVKGYVALLPGGRVKIQ